MNSILRWTVAAGAAAMLIPSMVSAQDSTDVQRRETAIVLNHTFTAPVNEPVRVFLAKGVRYRVEVQGTGIKLQIRPLMPSTPRPRIHPVLAGRSASHEVLYEVDPAADAVYVITPVAGGLASVVRVQVRALPPEKPDSTHQAGQESGPQMR